MRIKAELERRGYTLTGLSEQFGFHRSAVSKALKKPWPAVERVIADALGVVHPRYIWPDRYDGDGRHKSERHKNTNMRERRGNAQP